MRHAIDASLAGARAAPYFYAQFKPLHIKLGAGLENKGHGIMMKSELAMIVKV